LLSFCGLTVTVRAADGVDRRFDWRFQLSTGARNKYHSRRGCSGFNYRSLLAIFYILYFFFFWDFGSSFLTSIIGVLLFCTCGIVLLSGETDAILSSPKALIAEILINLCLLGEP
jgi:hypothetical protein